MPRNKLTYKRFLLKYAVPLLALVFLVNIAIFYSAHFFLLAQTCMTPQQVAADNRCLYIWGQQVFNKGSRSSPHHGHPCGTDVTSIIPSNHVNNQSSFLLPNFVANLCSATTPTPTVPQVTSTPVPTLTPTPITVPSPGCLGSCPTMTPVPTGSDQLSGGISQPTPTISYDFLSPSPTGGGNQDTNPTVPGDAKSLLEQILQLLQQLLDLLKSLHIDLSNNHGGGHHKGHHSGRH
jgi:hypothetical protein